MRHHIKSKQDIKGCILGNRVGKFHFLSSGYRHFLQIASEQITGHDLIIIQSF